MKKRTKVARFLDRYTGLVEGGAMHREILAIFNQSGLCKRYTMTVNDPWCATAVSAAFIGTGLQKYFPCVECSCEMMIQKAKAAGIWCEDDSHKPRVGEVVLYDWQDNGIGDCKGVADHVGIVYAVSDALFTVIEGNKNDTVGKRVLQVNGRYIRGFIIPNYPDNHKKRKDEDIEEVAFDVIAGKYGSGAERKRLLIEAGWDYAKVQDTVNKLLNQDMIKVVAMQVIQGQWGNGEARRKNLEAAGFNYEKVQKKVNELCRT